MKAKVLVTTAGTIVAQGIIKSLRLANTRKDAPVEYRIISTDMSHEAAGLYRSDVGLMVPPFSSADYIESIISICKNEGIDAIFLGADEELAKMAIHKERIEKETGAVLIVNPSDVITTCADKWETFEFLKRNNVPCPESSLPDNKADFVRESGFPMIVKPREGHGSLDLYVANSMEEVDRSISIITRNGLRPMLQQYIPSENLEFTTGVTIDRDGTYAMSSIAMRRTLKGGQTYKGFINGYEDIERASEKVALRVGGRGALNVQGRLCHEEFNIFEINPRFSASCPLRAVAKVNEPDIVFRNTVLNERIKVEQHDRIVCLRYWNEIYVPYPVYEQLTNSKKIEGEHSFIPAYF